MLLKDLQKMIKHQPEGVTKEWLRGMAYAAGYHEGDEDASYNNGKEMDDPVGEWGRGYNDAVRDVNEAEKKDKESDAPANQDKSIEGLLIATCMKNGIDYGIQLKSKLE